MKNSFCLLLCAALAAPVLAADTNFSGRWTVSPAPAPGADPAAAAARGGRGGGGGQTFTFTQVGGRITGYGGAGRADPGTAAPNTVDVIDLKIQGNQISFYTWGGGRDEPSKTMYVGTMNPDDTISFTVTTLTTPPLVPAAPNGSGGRGGGGGAGTTPAANGRGATPAAVTNTATAPAAPAAAAGGGAARGGPVPQQMIGRRSLAP